MEQCSRLLAMKRDNSLEGKRNACMSKSNTPRPIGLPVDKLHAHAKRSAQTVKCETTVRLQKLTIGQNAHFAHIEACMWGKETGRQEKCLFERR